MTHGLVGTDVEYPHVGGDGAARGGHEDGGGSGEGEGQLSIHGPHGREPSTKPTPVVGKERANFCADPPKSPLDGPESRPGAPLACHPLAVNVLLVEDDDAIAEPLAKGLERQGFVVHREATGLAGVETFRSSSRFDMILLDLGLPDIDGYEVCRRVRADSSTPIIILTARGDEIDRVLGLELGADDYMVKPFGLRELVARINAVSRRSNASGTPKGDTIALSGDVVIDTRTRRVTVGDEEIQLTRKEFDLLALLASDPGATQTRETILEQVWDAHWYGPTKTLDVHIASLRKKLGDPTLIETVRGVGFRLRASDDTESTA